MRVFHQNTARLDSPDSPGSVSQQHDVASEAFDRKVFVNRADNCALGLRKHGVQRILRNGAAAGNCCQTAATPGTDDAVHTIVMKICGVTSARAGDAFGEHFDNFVELRSYKIAIGIRTAHGIEQFCFIPVLRSTHGHNLLCQNVQGRFGNGDVVEISIADCAHHCGALYEFVARRREDPAFGYCAAPVTCPANALQADGNRTRRTDLANQVDRSDIDTEFERCGRHKGAELSGFQFFLGCQA